MNSANTTDVLNRLYAMHNRSLPIYLSYARPWAVPGDRTSMETLDLIVADQKSMIERLGELILESGGDVFPGEFPMTFTSLHDLAFDYLVTQLVDFQQRFVEAIKDCVDQLNLAPMAKAVAEEALGLAQGHLDNLLDLTRERESA